MNQKIILPHGGYQRLQSYRKSEIVFDATAYFTRRFYRRGDRTIDQMVQAARSGKQNIAEASQASAHSKEMEIKLTSVARASLEELLVDYLDFLRTRGLCHWEKDHPYSQRLRELTRDPEATYTTFQRGIENEDPTICANVILGLTRLTNYLLDRQSAKLERDFCKHGGLRERMSSARRSSRGY